MPAPGQSADALMASQSDRRAELARIEDAWFTNVKSGVSGIDASALETERSRRALARAQGSLRSGGLMMSTLLTSRQLRIDLHKAAADLSPEGRTKCAAPLQAWRTQLIAELASAQAEMDEAMKAQMAFMRSMVQKDDAGNTNASMRFTIDEKQAEQIERARKPLEATIARIDASQRAAVDAVAASLPAADAIAFRRAAQRQTHPEAFRSQEKVDAAVSRVLALPDLSTTTLEAVSTLADDFRTRSDALTERPIERTDKSDTAMSGVLQGGPGVDLRQMMRRVQMLQRADRSRGDAAYDREERNARTLRRLRALLTPEQAAANLHYPFRHENREARTTDRPSADHADSGRLLHTRIARWLAAGCAVSEADHQRAVREGAEGRRTAGRGAPRLRHRVRRLCGGLAAPPRPHAPTVARGTGGGERSAHPADRSGAAADRRP
jgi:hypothetical protein